MNKIDSVNTMKSLKPQMISYVPVYLYPEDLIKTAKKDVLPGVTLKRIPVTLAQEIKRINQNLPIKPTFWPNYVVCVDQDSYLDAFLARLEQEGKDVKEMLDEIPTQSRKVWLIQPRDIAKQVIISLLLIRDTSFCIGTYYGFSVEQIGSRKRYQIRDGIPNPGEERSVLMEHAWPQRSPKRIRTDHLRHLNDILEVYYRPNYWYADRIAVSLNSLWSALCSPYLDQAYLSLMMVFEALLSTRPFEITHMLSERAAILLGNDSEQRVQMYRTMKKLYNTRSKVAHGRAIKRKRGQITWDTLSTDAKRAIVPVSDLRTGLSHALSLIRTVITNNDLREIIQESGKKDVEKLDDYYLEMLMK